MESLNGLGKRGPYGLPGWVEREMTLWTPCGLVREVLTVDLNGLLTYHYKLLVLLY